MRVVLAAALACTACAGAAPAQSNLTGSLDSAVPACRPADVKGLFRGFQGAGDSLMGALVVVDSAPRACLLDGSPRSIALLDDSGDAVQVRQRALDLPPGGGAVQLRPGVGLPAFGRPPSHGSAWMSLNWSNWCSDASPTVHSMLVVLPGGGSIAVPMDPDLPAWAIGPPTPRCANDRGPSSLSFGRFQPAA